jgi:hypothetical protein
VRDFSAADPLVPAALRGTYAAFTLDGTHGGEHLSAWPTPASRTCTCSPRSTSPPSTRTAARGSSPRSTSRCPTASPRAAGRGHGDPRPRRLQLGVRPLALQRARGELRHRPDGPARILEFREMVMALWEDAGLRLVIDVVYNHTNAAGQGDRSVLDRIVPGYYHRLDAAGNVTTSTCCPNTATEHAMMERLMLDSVALWAEHYKVDAFRFDLMGHHMARNMRAVRDVLDALTPASTACTAAACTCTARAGTSARWRRAPEVRTPPSAPWPAAASAPSTIACATPCAAADRSTAVRPRRHTKGSPLAPSCCRTRSPPGRRGGAPRERAAGGGSDPRRPRGEPGARHVRRPLRRAGDGP